MLNAERFKKEILENSNVVSDFSISKDKHTIKKCLGVCGDCLFHEKGDHCSNIKIKWLMSEYKESVKLTRLEYEVLKYFYKVKEYRYIVRSDNGLIWLSFDKPHKIRTMWASNKPFGPFPLFGDLFKFVRLSDTEPTSIKDVLDNCEVVEDDQS